MRPDAVGVSVLPPKTDTRYLARMQEVFVRTRIIEVDQSHYATRNRDELFSGGEVFHSAKNTNGGSVDTPVARFFVTKPEIGAEGYHPHSRVDCVVFHSALVPDPASLARRLTDELLARRPVQEPLWLGWWTGQELSGEARGEVFDFD